MTPEQIEADIRSIKRTCKGPVIWTVGEQEDFKFYINALDATGTNALGDARRKIEETQSIIRERFHRVHPLPLPMPLETVREVTQNLVYLMRLHQSDLGTPCNYDINDLILANPLDGLEHTVLCPQCGTVITYTAPKYN